MSFLNPDAKYAVFIVDGTLTGKQEGKWQSDKWLVIGQAKNLQERLNALKEAGTPPVKVTVRSSDNFIVWYN